MGGICSRNEEIRNTHKILVGKRLVKRTLGKHRRGCEADIKIE
jgi:hypothetical protein